MTANRPTFHRIFMNAALLLAQRSTCDRTHVGAVITRNKRILATGYNGSPPGTPHCDEVGHLIDRCPVCDGQGTIDMYSQEIDSGDPPRLIAPEAMICRTCKGAGIYGGCKRTIHAEINAIIQCAIHGVSPEGGLVYVTTRPCLACASALAAAGIKGIVYYGEYTTDSMIAFMNVMDETGINIWKASDGLGVNGLDNPASFTLKPS